MVYSVRMQCGRVLAKEARVEADIVSSVPESGTAAAHGYAREVSSTLCALTPQRELKCKKKYVSL